MTMRGRGRRSNVRREKDVGSGWRISGMAEVGEVGEVWKVLGSGGSEGDYE